MICRKLEPHLVEILDPPGQLAVVRLSEAEVDDVEEVRAQESVDADVWLPQAHYGDHCVDETPIQKDCLVQILPKAVRAELRIEAPDALFSLHCLQFVPILAHKPDEEGRDQGKEGHECDSNSGVDSLLFCRETDHREGNECAQNRLQVALQEEAYKRVPQELLL